MLFVVIAFCLVSLFSTRSTFAEVLEVGPGKRFAAPSEASKVARDGDVVRIDATIYEGDVAVWTANGLTIQGVGERPHLKVSGANAQGKGIWVIKGNGTTVENIEFSGARVPELNGAAIRQEGIGLTVRNCYFHNNENGILAAGGEGEIVVEFSEFADNGHGDGQSHNIYIGRVKSFTLRGSYSHHARIGHNVKSRAIANYIVYNRIMDERSGTSSYAIDLPNGGVSYVIGNNIQKGPRSENSTIISYGAEGLRGVGHELYLINNTIVNDRVEGGRFAFIQAQADTVRIINNMFVGRGTIVSGPGELRNNLTSSQPGLADRENFDYHLIRVSPAIDAGTDPGTANGYSLIPAYHYVHKVRLAPRPNVDRLDIGAYEHQRQN